MVVWNGLLFISHRHILPLMMNFSDVRDICSSLADSQYRGVAGVKLFGPSEGKPVVITAMTHGDEACGLGVVWYFLQHPEVVAKLKSPVLFCINNLEGALRDGQRFIDVNMNRLPDDALKRGTEGYEFRRLAELAPLWEDAAWGIDIHAYKHPDPPMTIDVKGDAAMVAKLSGFTGLSVRATNMMPVQGSCPLAWFFGGAGKNIPAIEIECGSWDDPAGIEVAITACLSALVGMGVLDLPHQIVPGHQDIYRIAKTFRFPNLSYSLQCKHEHGDVIKVGEIIATGDGEPIIADRDYRVLLTRKEERFSASKDLQKEVLWLAEPPIRKPIERVVIPKTSL